VPRYTLVAVRPKKAQETVASDRSARSARDEREQRDAPLL
jgi:hypothetical protein